MSLFDKSDEASTPTFASRPKPLDDIEFRRVLSHHIQTRVDNLGAGKYTAFRIAAERFYEGELFGTEQEGRRKVVRRVLAETVDTIMPQLLRVFCSGDDAVRFEPRTPDEESAARQATDYVNWIWNNRKNNGYLNTRDVIHNRLLYRIGILKIWWDTRIDVKEENYEGITDEVLAVLKADPDCDILRDESYPEPVAQQQAEQAALQGIARGQPARAPPQVRMLHNVRIRQRRRTGHVCVNVVPPEQFLYAPYSTDLDRSPFLAHRQKLSRRDLRRQGFDEDLLAKVRFGANNDGLEYQEKFERFKKETFYVGEDQDNTEALQTATIIECYVRVDFDGDGIAELRKVIVAGDTADVVLSNELADGQPFAAFIPLPTPNKLVGLSISDQCMDLQLIQRTLFRQMLDNLYNNNNRRLVINDENVNIDDVLAPRPGGFIRAKNPQGDVFPLTVPNLIADRVTALGYAQDVTESATGARRYNQGLDGDRIDPETATQSIMLQQSGAMRVEMIARNLAETGMRQAMRRILQLVCEYQDTPDPIKLKGNWVQMNPREWRTEYDMTIHVGLGRGNKVLTMAHFAQLQQMTQAIAASPYGSILITPQNVYNQAAKAVEAMGLKGVDRYFTNPATLPPQAQQPQHPPTDPATAQAQAAIQAERIRTQQRQAERQQQGQLDQAKLTLEAKLKQEQSTRDDAFRREQSDRDEKFRRDQMAMEMALRDKELNMKYGPKVEVNIEHAHTPQPTA